MARRGWLLLDAAAWRRLRRIVLAAALMAAAVVAARAGLDAAAPALPRLVAVVMLVGFGFAVYMAALHLMRVAPLGELRDALRAAARRAP